MKNFAHLNKSSTPFFLTILITIFTGTTQISLSADNSPPNAEISINSSTQPAGTLPVSVANEVNAAIDRGLDWLAAQQKEDGSWSNKSFPALTALALQSFTNGKHPRRNEIIQKARAYILSCAHEDGGIFVEVKDRQGGGLSNYNTAICMTALHSIGDRSLAPVIQKARKFVASSQYTGDDIYKGGFGYDRVTDRQYTDLLNTFYSAEAMRITGDVEDTRDISETRSDINWQATIAYIEQMQNKPQSGAENAGGFFYKPGESKAGSTTNADGVIVFRSYGSMTYVGMLSLIYANVPRDDPRVLSAFHWSARHWSLEENPGMGANGMYFFYNILAKSLNAFGRDLIPSADGSFIDWRKEFALKMLSLQKIDPKTGQGYWQNDSGRFWENDPVLSTAYALIALEML